MGPNYYFANKYLSNSKSGNMSGFLSAGLNAASGFLGGILNEGFSDKHLKDAQNFALMQGDIDWERAVESFNMSNRRDDEVWNRQKQYNLDMWNMQNAYNSPSAQMARFKEAGLNPHLIYGQSNMGGSMSNATLDSSNMSGSSSHSPTQARGADWQSALGNVGSSLMNYVQFRQAAAQVDNTREYTDNLRANRMLTQANTLGALADVKGKDSDNVVKAANAAVAPVLASLSADVARLNRDKLQQDIDLSSKRDTRDETRLANEILKLRSDIQHNASSMSTEELRRKMLQFQIKLYELGPKATDVLNRFGGSLFEKGAQLYNDVKRGAKVEWNWK